MRYNRMSAPTPPSASNYSAIVTRPSVVPTRFHVLHVWVWEMATLSGTGLIADWGTHQCKVCVQLYCAQWCEITGRVVKLSLATPMRAGRGSRGIAPFILNIGARCMWGVSFKPRPLDSCERPPVQEVRVSPWCPLSVWTYMCQSDIQWGIRNGEQHNWGLHPWASSRMFVPYFVCGNGCCSRTFNHLRTRSSYLYIWVIIYVLFVSLVQ